MSLVNKVINIVGTPSIPSMIPTSKDTSSRDWKIASSSLSCGLRELQGWSSGIGINGNSEDFEKKLALLCYWSQPNNQTFLQGEKWYTKGVEGPTWGPIGVPRCLWQFLQAGQNYMHSSEKSWIDRFEKFVTENDLGSYQRTGSFRNPNYKGAQIEVAVWVWNGKHPDMSKVS